MTVGEKSATVSVGVGADGGDFARLLVRRMSESGVDFHRFCRRVGMPPNVVSGWMRGTVSEPDDPEVIEALSRTMGTDPDEFYAVLGVVPREIADGICRGGPQTIKDVRASLDGGQT